MPRLFSFKGFSACVLLMAPEQELVILFFISRIPQSIRVAAISLVLTCAIAYPVQAQDQEIWTLEASIRRVLEIAPETRAAQAEVVARRGALRQAGVWPNPQIELRIDDKIGKDQGSGGTSFSQFTFSQPLPLSGRLGHQRAIAGAELEAAQSERQYQRLHLETLVAIRYHRLQLAMETLQFAKQRLKLADELQDSGQRREQAGDLSKLERLRIDLIREDAQQILDKSEGEFNEALGQFRAYLGLPMAATPQLAPLEPFGPLPVLQQLQAGLPQHAALLNAQHRLKAARSSVDLARSRRIPDLTLSLHRERDFLNGRTQDVTGIGLGLTVPLWNRNNGRIDESQALEIRTQAEMDALERDLSSRVQQSYLHLNHLIQQGEHYRTRVFEPAQIVFDLTLKAYASGEVEILSLIDANNIYFDSRGRYLELLQEAWLEAAELRLAAGQPLVTAKQDTNYE